MSDASSILSLKKGLNGAVAAGKTEVRASSQPSELRAASSEQRAAITRQSDTVCVRVAGDQEHLGAAQNRGQSHRGAAAGELESLRGTRVGDRLMQGGAPAGDKDRTERGEAAQQRQQRGSQPCKGACEEGVLS